MTDNLLPLPPATIQRINNVEFTSISDMSQLQPGMSVSVGLPPYDVWGQVDRIEGQTVYLKASSVGSAPVGNIYKVAGYSSYLPAPINPSTTTPAEPAPNIIAPTPPPSTVIQSVTAASNNPPFDAVAPMFTIGTTDIIKQNQEYAAAQANLKKYDPYIISGIFEGNDALFSQYQEAFNIYSREKEEWNALAKPHQEAFKSSNSLTDYIPLGSNTTTPNPIEQKAELNKAGANLKLFDPLIKYEFNDPGLKDKRGKQAFLGDEGQLEKYNQAIEYYNRELNEWNAIVAPIQNSFSLPASYIYSPNAANTTTKDPLIQQRELEKASTNLKLFDPLFTGVDENRLFLGTEEQGIKYKNAVDYYNRELNEWKTLSTFDNPILTPLPSDPSNPNFNPATGNAYEDWTPFKIGGAPILKSRTYMLEKARSEKQQYETALKNVSAFDPMFMTNPDNTKTFIGSESQYSQYQNTFQTYQKEANEWNNISSDLVSSINSIKELAPTSQSNIDFIREVSRLGVISDENYRSADNTFRMVTKQSDILRAFNTDPTEETAKKLLYVTEGVNPTEYFSLEKGNQAPEWASFWSNLYTAGGRNTRIAELQTSIVTEFSKQPIPGTLTLLKEKYSDRLNEYGLDFTPIETQLKPIAEQTAIDRYGIGVWNTAPTQDSIELAIKRGVSSDIVSQMQTALSSYQADYAASKEQYLADSRASANVQNAVQVGGVVGGTLALKEISTTVSPEVFSNLFDFVTQSGIDTKATKDIQAITNIGGADEGTIAYFNLPSNISPELRTNIKNYLGDVRNAEIQNTALNTYFGNVAAGRDSYQDITLWSYSGSRSTEYGYTMNGTRYLWGNAQKGHELTDEQFLSGVKAYLKLGADDRIVLAIDSNVRVIQESNLGRTPTLTLTESTGDIRTVSPFDYARELSGQVEADRQAAYNRQHPDYGGFFADAAAGIAAEKNNFYITDRPTPIIGIENAKLSELNFITNQATAKTAYDNIMAGNTLFDTKAAGLTAFASASLYRPLPGNIETMKLWEAGGMPKLPDTFTVIQPQEPIIPASDKSSTGVIFPFYPAQSGSIAEKGTKPSPQENIYFSYKPVNYLMGLSGQLQTGLENILGYSPEASLPVKFVVGAGSVVTGLPAFAGQMVFAGEAIIREPVKAISGIPTGLGIMAAGISQQFSSDPYKFAGSIFGMIAIAKLSTMENPFKTATEGELYKIETLTGFKQEQSIFVESGKPISSTFESTVTPITKTSYQRLLNEPNVMNIENRPFKVDFVENTDFVGLNFGLNKAGNFYQFPSRTVQIEGEGVFTFKYGDIINGKNIAREAPINNLNQLYEGKIFNFASSDPIMSEFQTVINAAASKPYGVKVTSADTGFLDPTTSTITKGFNNLQTPANALGGNFRARVTQTRQMVIPERIALESAPIDLYPKESYPFKNTITSGQNQITTPISDFSKFMGDESGVFNPRSSVWDNIPTMRKTAELKGQPLTRTIEFGRSFAGPLDIQTRPIISSRSVSGLESLFIEPQTGGIIGVAGLNRLIPAETHIVSTKTKPINPFEFSNPLNEIAEITGFKRKIPVDAISTTPIEIASPITKQVNQYNTADARNLIAAPLLKEIPIPQPIPQKANIRTPVFKMPEMIDRTPNLVIPGLDFTDFTARDFPKTINAIDFVPQMQKAPTLNPLKLRPVMDVPVNYIIPELRNLTIGATRVKEEGKKLLIPFIVTNPFTTKTPAAVQTPLRKAAPTTYDYPITTPLTRSFTSPASFTVPVSIENPFTAPSPINYPINTPITTPINQPYPKPEPYSSGYMGAVLPSIKFKFPNGEDDITPKQKKKRKQSHTHSQRTAPIIAPLAGLDKLKFDMGFGAAKKKTRSRKAKK